MAEVIKEMRTIYSERRTCRELGYSRATFQRKYITVKSLAVVSGHDSPSAGAACVTIVSRQVKRHQARCNDKAARRAVRSLNEPQRQALLDAVHETRFVDRSVPYIYATLLDENRYYGSISTMYRVLRSVGEVRERRDQATRPAHVKPELCATGPNQVYAWDITKLHGPQKWTYFHLYTVIDIYSRYVVGWMIADRESSELARTLLEQTVKRYAADPKKLTIHADRGSSMKSKPVAFLLADLGVTKSHSRPRVSNDNPHIESLFKTVKYQPEFPATFRNLEEARYFCRTFFHWYNTEHRHSGIALLTPEDVHFGRAEQRQTARQVVLDKAYAQHPERFVRGRPTPLRLAPVSYINRPIETSQSSEELKQAA